jgi:hypothetical protein
VAAVLAMVQQMPAVTAAPAVVHIELLEQLEQVMLAHIHQLKEQTVQKAELAAGQMAAAVVVLAVQVQLVLHLLAELVALVQILTIQFHLALG